MKIFLQCVVVFIGEVDGRRVEEAHEGAAHEEDEDELHVEHLAAGAFREQRAEGLVLGILGVVPTDAILLAQTGTEIDIARIDFTVSNNSVVTKSNRTHKMNWTTYDRIGQLALGKNQSFSFRR